MTGVLEKLEERTLEETEPIVDMEPILETDPILEESDFSRGALLFAPLKQWQLWVVAGGLALLVALCLGLWRRTRAPDSGDERERSISITEEVNKEEREDDFHPEERLVREKIRRSARSLACRRWEVETVVGDVLGVLQIWRRTRAPDSGDERERSISITEEVNKEEREDDFHPEERLVREKIRRSARRLACRRWEVETVVGDVLGVLQKRLSQNFFLVPQAAIGVGSAFEGWSPCGPDAVFRLLVPLKPSRGHAFQLELGPAGDTAAKHRVRVDLACTCSKEARGEEAMLCFVHQPYEALERDQDSGLLCQLCTGRYLDAQKVARWFQELVSSAWEEMGLGRRYRLRVLPSRRSCKLELTGASGRSVVVELLFGVQRGESDLFLSSQAPEAIFTPGIMWTESSAVAEAKFFSHVARQALPDSLHLQCLQLLTGSLGGTVLSSYTFKTAVMHLLNLCPGTSVPFTLQLQDVMDYLRSCLEEKRLHHFIFGNECLPEAIVLPPATQPAEPVNLFQCLVEDPEAHAKALREFQELQGRLTGLLLFGA
ncbi:PREDICTED: inositol 1,4,5-trisphosphate receptor-interacting protein-like 1 [Calidris pugnax]|uniref:inositol 1,4,5-trisphosphate receptor-interacting protein-like 1 n=1 Tax=Calidris pugnax TaxID=198806 RepID=UPI00071DAB2F|nr:PREDICTED: inositol 1,4,5-trisphosphate receptor-interacting protein-like 1 [Calidris pugnax]